MIEHEKFKGHNLLVLKRDKDDKYPFKFGAGKAKLIIDHFNEIKKFWEENALKGPTTEE